MNGPFHDRAFRNLSWKASRQLAPTFFGQRAPVKSNKSDIIIKIPFSKISQYQIGITRKRRVGGWKIKINKDTRFGWPYF